MYRAVCVEKDLQQCKDPTELQNNICLFRSQSFFVQIKVQVSSEQSLQNERQKNEKKNLTTLFTIDVRLSYDKRSKNAKNSWRKSEELQ